MLDVALNFLWPDGMMDHTCLDPVNELPAIANTFRLTETADGFVALITVTDDQWKGLMRGSRAGRPAGRSRSSVRRPTAMRNGGTGHAEDRPASCAKMPTEEVVARLTAHDVPVRRRRRPR